MSSPLKCARCGKKPTVPGTPRQGGAPRQGASEQGPPALYSGVAEVIDADLSHAAFANNLRTEDARQIVLKATERAVQASQSPAGAAGNSTGSPPLTGQPDKKLPPSRGNSPATTPRQDSVFARLAAKPRAGGSLPSEGRGRGRQHAGSPSTPPVPPPARTSAASTPPAPAPVRMSSTGRRAPSASRSKSPEARVKTSPAPQKQVDVQALETVFSKFTGGSSHMDGRIFAKLCKDSQLVDKRFALTDADLIFSKVVPKGLRRIDMVDFLRCLELVADKKRATLQSVYSAVTSSGGPVLNASPAERVRLHDDKSTYTGVHVQPGHESPRKAWREASRAVAIAGRVLKKQEGQHEGISMKLLKARETVAALELELADSEAQVQKAREEHERAQEQLRTVATPPASAFDENIIVYTPTELPQDDPESKEIHDAYVKLKTMAEEFRLKCETQKAKIATPKAREAVVPPSQAAGPALATEDASVARFASEEASTARAAIAEEFLMQYEAHKAKITAPKVAEVPQARIVEDGKPTSVKEIIASPALDVRRDTLLEDLRLKIESQNVRTSAALAAGGVPAVSQSASNTLSSPGLVKETTAARSAREEVTRIAAELGEALNNVSWIGSRPAAVEALGQTMESVSLSNGSCQTLGVTENLDTTIDALETAKHEGS